MCFTSINLTKFSVCWSIRLLNIREGANRNKNGTKHSFIHSSIIINIRKCNSHELDFQEEKIFVFYVIFSFIFKPSFSFDSLYGAGKVVGK